MSAKHCLKNKHLSNNLSVVRARLFHYLIVLLLCFLFQPAIAAETCSKIFAQSAAYRLDKKSSQLDFNAYLTKTMTVGDHGVSKNWLRLVKALSKENLSTFQTFIPKEYLDLKSGTRGTTLSEINRPNRRLKEGFFEDGKNFYVPSFYHLSSSEGAKQILDSQVLKITTGAHNRAAICLGDAGFRMFPSRRDLRKPDRNLTLMHVELDKEAKILDLSESYGDSPGEFSHLNAFKWYQNIFLENLKAGKYVSALPELTRLISKYIEPYEWLELRSKEAFALLMGADLILTSEKYGQIFLDEYWVINPLIVKSIQYYDGVQPE